VINGSGNHGEGEADSRVALSHLDGGTEKHEGKRKKACSKIRARKERGEPHMAEIRADSGGGREGEGQHVPYFHHPGSCFYHRKPRYNSMGGKGGLLRGLLREKVSGAPVFNPR